MVSTVPADQSAICGIPNKYALLISMAVGWVLFLFLFIFGCLLISGTFGNAHPKVLEVMNCGTPGKSVSCARVYGYRSEGVVVIILSFFMMGWAAVLTAAFFIYRRRGSKQPMPHGGIALRPTHAHIAQFATSQA